MRAGWRAARQRNELETGIDVLAALPNPSTASWQLATGARPRPERRLVLPEPRLAGAGGVLRFTATSLRTADGGRQRCGAARQLDAGRPRQHPRSPRGDLPLLNLARLGGFFNLSAYAPGQFLGDDASYVHERAERIIGRLPLGLRGDMRIGMALEAGRLRQPLGLAQNGWPDSVTLYLSCETPLGPAYVGIGQARDDKVNAYLVVGIP